MNDELTRAAAKVIEAHRDWCNYCHGVPEYCRRAPPGGCSVPALEAAITAPASEPRPKPVAHVNEMLGIEWSKDVQIQTGMRLYLSPVGDEKST